MTDGVALIPSATYKTKSHDTLFPFRQDSNFHYLTGYNEDGALLVLCNNHASLKSILFVTPNDPHTELWTGRRMSATDVQKLTGVDEVIPMTEMDGKLSEFLIGHKKLYIDLFCNANFFNKMVDQCRKLSPKRSKVGHRSPEQFIDLTPVIGKLRLFKDSSEIENIKLACEISNKAHKMAMAQAKPGMNESRLQALMEYIFKCEGAQGPAYGTIIAGGNNATTLHYENNDMLLVDGELVLIDAGCEYNFYASDITRTFPVNGKFTPVQRDLYQLVLDAQIKAIDNISCGLTLNQNHDFTARIMTEGLIELKLLEGSVDENMEEKKYKKYFPHGLGHWMGVDVHDNTPSENEKDEEIQFKEGMVFTVEPGIYIPLDDETTKEEFRGIGIRIEDDILITKDGKENLTQSTPKSIEDIENACRAEPE